MNNEEEKKKKTTTKKTTSKKGSKTTTTKKKTTKKENVTKKDLVEEVKEEKVKPEEGKEEIKEEVIEAKPVKEEKKDKKATLLQRAIAFILDIFIVSLISSLIAFPFVDNDKAEKLSNETTEVVQKYVDGDMSLKTYSTEMADITYQMAKSNGTVTLVTLVCEILYFVVFQLYNNGQTIGKKVLRIKVVSDNKNLTMNQMICRSLIVNSILLEIISFCFMLFAGKTIYFYGVAIFEMIQYVVLIISICMIMGSKEGKGVHDRLAHTRVIRL